MVINFYKYHGTGNDFIMIDNTKSLIKLVQSQIKLLCDRHFGIGADGLILIETSENHDFYMQYFNADGRESTMCGNGGRCSVHFAKSLGLVKGNHTIFEAIDGLHKAEINDNIIALQMQNVSKINIEKNYCYLDTGSPHHVEFTKDTDKVNVYEEGKKIRYGHPYNEGGSNVNFVTQIEDNVFKVRTYERGVENETLSCGTGVTASAIAAFETGKTNKKNIYLNTLGGQLEVTFEKDNNTYKNVILKGPATFVFKGSIEINY